MGAYYEVQDDLVRTPRWYLREPMLGGKPFRYPSLTAGAPVDVPGELSIELRQDGPRVDFTFADFAIPVVRREVAEALHRAAFSDLQRIPVRVLGELGAYEIINVISISDCLDDQRSRVTYWPADEAPEGVGSVLAISKLCVDPKRTGERKVFRIANWLAPIIVDESVAKTLHCVSGVTLSRVSE